MDRLIKTPAEKYPIYPNFSIDLIYGQAIVAFQLACVNKDTGADSSATIIDSSSLSSPEVEVVIKAGTEDEVHEITCRGQTSGGSWHQRDILLEIKTVVTDDFIKQPDDNFTFAVEFARRLVNGDGLASAAATAVKESDESDVYGSIVLAPYIVGTLIGVPVTGGVHAETYRIGVLGTTDNGYVYEKTIRMIGQEF